MAPFLSKPGRLVPIPAAANQSRHSGGSYKLGWEAWSQQLLSARAGLVLPPPAAPLAPGGRKTGEWQSCPGPGQRPAQE